MSDTHGSVHWTELMTRDPAAAQAFYESVCGWTFNAVPMPFGDYLIGMKCDVPTIGIMDMTKSPDDAEMEPFWMTYFAVDNVDAVAAAVASVGGTVKNEPFDVPEVGRIAIIIDPTGAMVGLMTPSG